MYIGVLYVQNSAVFGRKGHSVSTIGVHVVTNGSVAESKFFQLNTSSFNRNLRIPLQLDYELWLNIMCTSSIGHRS